MKENKTGLLVLCAKLVKKVVLVDCRELRCGVIVAITAYHLHHHAVLL